MPMPKFLLFLLLPLVSCSVFAEELPPQPDRKTLDSSTTIHFDKPASSFLESLPLGNGRIGAMVFRGRFRGADRAQ
jgi:hypothetical protein